MCTSVRNIFETDDINIFKLKKHSEKVGRIQYRETLKRSKPGFKSTLDHRLSSSFSFSQLKTCMCVCMHVHGGFLRIQFLLFKGNKNNNLTCLLN